MKTIVEPKEHIDKLWGKQRIHEDAVYRQMRYVLRVDHDGKVLLHNVVTGRLVVLDGAEAEALEKLPVAYSPVMEQLVTGHYLVPEDYDEHQQVVNLRTILQRMQSNSQSKDIVVYTILPTTACNARCYYCFEQGCETATMTEQTAYELVEFISNNRSKSQSVLLTWFGGEPTVASHRIDQICNGLKEKKVAFRSKMMTNGYLFDEDMVRKAKSLWQLQAVQICLDGTKETYNRTKAFVGVKDDPFERVMRNLGLLVENKIHVSLRMNFDLANYHEFSDLIEEVIHRFGHSEYLYMNAHPIIGEYKDNCGRINHGTDAWFAEKRLKLNELARHERVQQGIKELPSLNYTACEAYNDSCVVITPNGSIVKCPEQFEDNQVIGNIKDGITNTEIIRSWKIIADYQICDNCPLVPNCLRLSNCNNKGYCHMLMDYLTQCHELIIKFHDNMPRKE